ncbi:MAG: VOC family protein [Candidatus Eisenbacteria bacterium]
MDAPLSLGFDHLVVSVPSLSEAIEHARNAGFTVHPGGRHSELPTENALIAFADGGYLELLAPRTRMSRVAARRLVRGPEWQYWRRRVDAVGRRFLPHLGRLGVCDLVLRGAELSSFAARARAHGVFADGPIAMGRERPDGRVLAWELLMPDSFNLPFLIEDITPREWRVPSEPAAVTHANGATGVASVTMRVRNLTGAAERWNAWCDAPPPDAEASTMSLAVAGLQIVLELGTPPADHSASWLGTSRATLAGVHHRATLAAIAHWGITGG